MCLLQTGTSAALTSILLDTRGLILDIYDSNSDGLGVMYIDNGALQIAKVLPKDATAAREFIERLPQDDRQMAIHWRMKTHGAIDLTNCHPYDIEPGVSALMHNGVLHTGNKKDPSKSDTWHFVNDFLRSCKPDTLHDPAFIKLLGEYIDNNRFAIMTEDGRLSVVNHDQGVEHGGVWFSNTYAWSPELVIPGYRKYSGYTSGYSSWGTRRNVAGQVIGGPGYDEDDAWGSYYGRMEQQEREADEAGDSGGFPTMGSAQIADLVESCLNDYDSATLADLFDSIDGPEAVEYVWDNYHIAVYHRLDLEKLSTPDMHALTTWTEGDLDDLLEKLGSGGAQRMAESLIYNCVLTQYTGGADEDAPEPTKVVPSHRIHDLTDQEFAALEVDEWGVVREGYSG